LGQNLKSPSAVYQSQLDDTLVTQDKSTQEEYGRNWNVKAITIEINKFEKRKNII
jgi:hypothetical protein